MIIVLGTVKLAPDKVAGALGAMAKMVAASRAEPGCITYSYAQDLLDPETIHVIEKWRDRQALTHHFHTPHMGEWRDAIGSLGIADRNLRAFETGEGEAV